MLDNGAVYFRVDTKYVHYVNRIFEGYEYLGVVSTVDKSQRLLVVRATPDTAATARGVLVNLPIPLELVDEHEIDCSLK